MHAALFSGFIIPYLNFFSTDEEAYVHSGGVQPHEHQYLYRVLSKGGGLHLLEFLV